MASLRANVGHETDLTMSAAGWPTANRGRGERVVVSVRTGDVRGLSPMQVMFCLIQEVGDRGQDGDRLAALLLPLSGLLPLGEVLEAMPVTPFPVCPQLPPFPTITGEALLREDAALAPRTLRRRRRFFCPIEDDDEEEEARPGPEAAVDSGEDSVGRRVGVA